MGRTILPFWFCPSEPRPSFWEQNQFSTGDPSYRGAGTSYAYNTNRAAKVHKNEYAR